MRHPSQRGTLHACDRMYGMPVRHDRPQIRGQGGRGRSGRSWCVARGPRRRTGTYRRRPPAGVPEGAAEDADHRRELFEAPGREGADGRTRDQQADPRGLPAVLGPGAAPARPEVLADLPVDRAYDRLHLLVRVLRIVRDGDLHPRLLPPGRPPADGGGKSRYVDVGRERRTRTYLTGPSPLAPVSGAGRAARASRTYGHTHAACPAVTDDASGTFPIRPRQFT